MVCKTLYNSMQSFPVQCYEVIDCTLLKIPHILQFSASFQIFNENRWLLRQHICNQYNQQYRNIVTTSCDIYRWSVKNFLNRQRSPMSLDQFYNISSKTGFYTNHPHWLKSSKWKIRTSAELRDTVEHVHLLWDHITI